MTQSAQSWTVKIDPGTPYMADHQPGGAPLLGTVAQLSLITQCADELSGSKLLVAMENITIDEAYIINDNTPGEVIVTISPDDTRETLHCVLRSYNNSETRQHMTVELSYAEKWPAVAATTPLDFPTNNVCQAQIYACFFHGPAFRILERAARVGKNEMLARSVTQLPNWSDEGVRSACAPRLIEFGLQTAGLYHLANQGAMLIPKRIKRIERFSDADVGDGTTYIARASPSLTDEAMNMLVTTQAGLPIVQITGYACEALPFAHNNAAADRLHDQLNAPQLMETL